MFAKPQLRLCPIFLSLLFTFSVSLSMYEPGNEPFRYSNKKATRDNRSYKSNKYSSDEDDSFYGERPYKPKGKYSNPKLINSEFNEQLIETAPRHIKLWILGLKNNEQAKEMSCYKRLLLHGLPGNGKTSLAKAIALAVFGKYYYISAPSLLTKWKNCHEDLRAEIDPLIQKGEPIVIIIDEMDKITNQYKNRNSSDENMPVAFWTLLDECAIEAPFLIFIGTTNNEKEDFPDELISRFEGKMVYIPNPNISIREKIVNAQLNETKNNLDDIDKIILVEQLAGRSCRNIIDVLERAIFYSFEIDGVTWKLINLAMEEIPCPPSKYQRLAQRCNMTENEVKEVIADKTLLEKNHETVDFILKKKGIDLQQASFDQAAEHQRINNAQAVLSYNHAVESQNTNNAQAVLSYNHTVQSQNTNHAQTVLSYNHAVQSQNTNNAQAVLSYNHAIQSQNTNNAQAIASFNQQAQHHADTNYRQDSDTLVDGVTTGVRNGIIGGILGGGLPGAIAGFATGVIPSVVKVKARNL